MTVTLELSEETVERLNSLPESERSEFASAAIETFYLLAETPADLWRKQQKRRERDKIERLAAQASESLELAALLKPAA